jgi:putative sugar O-methyltransferase
MPLLDKLTKAARNPAHAAERLAERLLRRLGPREYAAAPLNRADSDNGSYIAAVQAAVRSPRAFQTFKRNLHYRAILEHVTPEQGRQYLATIRAEHPDFLARIERFKDNDIVGGAARVDYPETGPISPSTLRYIKVAADLVRLFQRDLGPRVAEIGVGYGGQLLVLDRAARFATYDLFDLQPVLDLTAKYLECHVLECAYRTVTLNRHIGPGAYDLVISNYAFSELPAAVQRTYITKVIAGARRGYLTMNSGQGNARSHNKLSLAELRTLLPPFEVLPERPATAPDNYLIVWGHSPAT